MSLFISMLEYFWPRRVPKHEVITQLLRALRLAEGK